MYRKVLAAADGGEHYQRRHRHVGHARDCIIKGKESVVANVRTFQLSASNSELGFEEYKTSAYIGDILEAAGDSEFTAMLAGPPGLLPKSIAANQGLWWRCRADMDALGHIIDGRLEARHTCGHDGHSSVVLTAAEEILAERLVKRGKLSALFQPAEELGTGRWR